MTVFERLTQLLCGDMISSDALKEAEGIVKQLESEYVETIIDDERTLDRTYTHYIKDVKINVKETTVKEIILSAKTSNYCWDFIRITPPDNLGKLFSVLFRFSPYGKIAYGPEWNEPITRVHDLVAKWLLSPYYGGEIK